MSIAVLQGQMPTAILTALQRGESRLPSTTADPSSSLKWPLRGYSGYPNVDLRSEDGYQTQLIDNTATNRKSQRAHQISTPRWDASSQSQLCLLQESYALKVP